MTKKAFYQADKKVSEDFFSLEKLFRHRWSNIKQSMSKNWISANPNQPSRPFAIMPAYQPSFLPVNFSCSVLYTADSIPVCGRILWSFYIYLFSFLSLKKVISATEWTECSPIALFFAIVEMLQHPTIEGFAFSNELLV